MSSRLNNQEREPFGVLRVLRTKAEARAFYNKIARVYDFLSENREEPVRNFGLEHCKYEKANAFLRLVLTGSSLVEVAKLDGIQAPNCGRRVVSLLLNIRNYSRIHVRGKIHGACGISATITRLRGFTDMKNSVAISLTVRPVERMVLSIDDCPPIENVACLVNGFLVHVVVSHRHLHVTVAHQISKRW
jgi:hypothetical protein